MEKISENIIQKLIEINFERKHSYETAAEFVSLTDKKKFLLELSSQSEGFIMELAYFLKLYGGSMGALSLQEAEEHREVFKISHSDQAIFLVLLQQETKRIASYNHLLSEGINLDNTLFEKIRAQKSELMETKGKLMDPKA